MIFDKAKIRGSMTQQVIIRWKQCDGTLPTFLPIYSEIDKDENSRWMQVKLAAIKAEVEGFPYGRAKRPLWKKNLEGLMQEAMESERIIGLSKAIPQAVVDDYMREMKAFIRKTRAFDKKLSMEDLGQALRNYLVYGVFRDMNGLPQKCTSAIWGYSMLYPYTDNYLDEQGKTEADKKAYNDFIRQKIKGKPYKADSLHKKKTIKLLEAIEESWPRETETDIYEGLSMMLEAQAESQKQYRNRTLSVEEVLAISVYKGGLSVLIDRYLVGTKINEEESMFYFAFGFLLQLCDDLQDIGSDRENGSQTILSMSADGSNMDAQVGRILHYAKNIFAMYDCKCHATKDFMERCTYLLILLSAKGSGRYLSKEGRTWVEERLPIRTADFEKEVEPFCIHKIMDEKKKRKYWKLIDYFCEETP